MNDPFLEARLRSVARRRTHLRLASRLAVCWLLTLLVGLVLFALLRPLGLVSPYVLLAVGLAGVGVAIREVLRHRRKRTDWRAIAKEVEAGYPELEGRLLTAVQQETVPGVEPGYLQRRLADEALSQSCRQDWGAVVPRSRVMIAHAANFLAFALVVVVFWGLRPVNRQAPRLPFARAGVEVTPGDTALEKGQSLVVMARFRGPLPANVELVLDVAGEAKRLPLVKSLSDPLFGGTVPEVTSNLLYRLEFGDQRTRDYRVTVFEHPRLERADLALTYPSYTRLGPQRLENTRRASAVEGSKLDVALQLNKPVVSARLVAKGPEAAALTFEVDTNRPAALLRGFPLTASQTYELQLVDADGRTNKVPAQFVFNALQNRVPELKLTSPRGDQRPSPLEEIAFDGQVWDDFGVEAYGLAFNLVGQDPQFVELGRGVAAKERRPFHHLLRLEDLQLQPDQLISWHTWADDIGPDGQVRRTVGDLFFGEIRPFEEVYREGQGQDQAQQQAGNEPSDQQGNPSVRLAELQKQIINATWTLRRGPSGPSGSSAPARRPEAPKAEPAVADAYAKDAAVVRDSQAQALEQAEEAREQVEDPRTAGFWVAVTEKMEAALEQLEAAVKSPAPLPAALAAEQAAYQALLKLQQREYEVTRSRRNRQGQQAGGRQQQMQQQLDQLDLTQSENRYETERQAQAPQSPERREQLQVLNRLQELARRQQDLNERLKELQTALQEARTEREREELRRELKRLQDQEQQMLADVDELQQRMDRPENQSRLAEQRRQMEQARQDMQRAAEAAGQGAASQALAAGTRAQRQLQETRDQLRRDSAGEFAEDLRTMRAEARELARQQTEIEKQLDALADPRRRSLSDSAERQELLDRLGQQKSRLTNVVDRTTQLSQQSEEPEPLVSRELYDSLRKFSQDEAATVQQIQNDLIERGILTQRTYDRLKETGERDGAKALEVTAEMVRQGLLPQADRAEERARAGIGDLRRGIERAAERILGDDTEALRLAQRELEALTGAVEREIARAERGTNTNATANGQASGTRSPTAGERGEGAGDTNAIAQAGGGRGQTGEPEPGGNQRQPGGERGGEPAAQQAQAGTEPGEQSGQQGQEGQEGQEGQGGQIGRIGRIGQDGEAGGDRRRGSQNDGPGGRGGFLSDALDRVFDDGNLRGTGPYNGPLTGEDFAPWSDRLREVEEMVELPSLRSEIAQARERARRLRVEYRRDLKKPDWAVVRLEVVRPLVEVRQQIADELARREPKDNLVPIDRDPVPGRFSELVRRYYEDLGRANRGGAP